MSFPRLHMSFPRLNKSFPRDIMLFPQLNKSFPQLNKLSLKLLMSRERDIKLRERLENKICMFLPRFRT